MVVDRRFTNADGLTLAYRDWGQGPRALVCVHGLYRNSRDFDALAEALSGHMRVIAIDMMGRGGSDYAADPDRYNVPFYLRDVLDLTSALGLGDFDYLGTSMGGIVGMVLAAEADSPVRHLVLNDVGPEISLAKLRELGELSRLVPESFADYAAARAFYRPAMSGWGKLSEEQLEHLVSHSVRREGERWVVHYDRRIMEGYRWPPGDVDLWPLYRQIRAPVLVLRGARSDVLAADTAERLRAEPGTTVLEIAGAGHAPSLMTPEQIAAIERFLAD